MTKLKCIPGVSQIDHNNIINLIKSFLGKTQNAKLYLYGSRAKGHFRKYSDIDLFLMANYYDDETLNKIDFSETDLAYKIDFSLEKNLFPSYREDINKTMIEIQM
jgi:predicted nucleotidyltransferase